MTFLQDMALDQNTHGVKSNGTIDSAGQKLMLFLTIWSWVLAI